MILDKKLTVDRVATRIIEEYEDFLNIMFSDENAQNLVLRIRWGLGRMPGRAWCGEWARIDAEKAHSLVLRIG